MVAYSFKGRFAEPILAGTKRQTIRNHRKRHARPGEQVQLYTGMRTKHCKLVGRAQCLAVELISIDLAQETIGVEQMGYFGGPALDDFARLDGFADWADMAGFWRKEHPGQSEFHGVLISWGPLL